MIFGYARVSTKKQKLARQKENLKLAGCEKIYSEKTSGREDEKSELNKLLSQLRKGDIVVVDSLDRLGRTSKQLISLLNNFNKKGVHLRSLKEGTFDTTTAMGKAIYEIIAILKAMEVEVLRERTNEGLNRARERGRVGGRPKGLNQESKMKAEAVASLYKQGLPISEIMKDTNVKSKATIYRYLRFTKTELGKKED